jgi:hypothetical protein
MNESQAREIIAYAQYMAGLTEKEPSYDQWKEFSFYVIGPIFLSPKQAAVLKKYSIENSAGLMAQFIVLDKSDDNSYDLRHFFRKAIREVQASKDMNLDPIAFASYLAKYLRTGFWWKITELEKSLRTSLRDALKHKKFEHSGGAGSLVSQCSYWPAGKIGWEVFEGDLDAFNNLYPPGEKAAYPDDKTQLPGTGELRQAIVEIFHSLNKKIWFKTFLNWLNSEESPYHAKSFNPDTDVGLPPEPADPDGPSSEELIDRAEYILSGLKPQYQQTFKMAYIWYKKHWEKSSLGYKELEMVTGKKTSVLHEHFKKIANPHFVKPLMEKYPHRKDLLREVFNRFRKKYSDHNPEKTHPELFKVKKKP